MKKVFVFIFVYVFCLVSVVSCFAGDIPECLLSEDTAMVFYGEVKEASEERITVVVTENIKGMAKVEETYSYEEWIFTKNPIVGEIYLCGYYDENNPFNIWEIVRKDEDTIDILDATNMSNRMEEYINNGDFHKAQQELLKGKEKAIEETSVSIGIIGGADGPTNIFLSSDSEGGGTVIFGVAAIAIVMVVIAAVAVTIHTHRNKK